MKPNLHRVVAVGLSVALPLAGIGPLESRAAALRSGLDFGAIEEYIVAEMRASRIPGLAVSIVKDDQIAFLKGYGTADPSGYMVTGQTPFIIGSVTKSFTALAVMQLVEAGRIELDAPVQRYLPWFRVADPEASARITVRHLLNQTSGLSQTGGMQTMTWTDDGNDALEAHVRYLAGVELNRPVGKSYEYSNANYISLGLIVQTVSGQSYEAYVQEHIFAPLDMRHSYVSQDEALQQGMATGHRWWFGVPLPVTLPYNRGDLPAGYVIASAEDMAHFLIAQMNGGRYGDVTVLSSAGVALMHTEPVPDTYGMGWFSDEVEGREVIGHEGGSFNFQSAAFFDPQARVAVFIVANVIGLMDAFSSPQGTTTRRMTESVLSLATSDALPEQGMGIANLYWVVDAVVLLLTGLLVVALARMPRRYRRLARRGVPSRFGLAWRIALAAVLHFLWPAALLYMAVAVPAWQVTVIMQPDLGHWLEAVALITFVKGLIEIVMLARVFAQGHLGRPLQTSPVPTQA
jgi:CubicO group peptidase (beta-lactamase class C family)